MISWRVFSVALISALVLGFQLGTVVAKADEQCGISGVSASIDVPDYTRKTSRVSAQLHGGDDISVVFAPARDINMLGDYLNNQSKGCILILHIGDDLWVRGNDWVSSSFLEEKLDRIDNVSRNPMDQTVKLIDQIHQFQEDTPSPTAAPPPPPSTPGPDISVEVVNHDPPQPSFWDFHWWNWAWGWAPILFVVLFIIWLPLERRRRRRYGSLAKRAEEQIDWGLDKYDIKTTVD